MSDPRLDIGPQLTGAATDACRDALDGVRPIVRVAADLDPRSATAAAALVHLLGRLHPHTTIDGDVVLGLNPWAAASLSEAAGLVPRPTPTSAARRDVVIGIGRVADADLWVGGDDWTAAISATPVDALSRHVAFGVHAAAALAAAEILKLVLAPFEFVHSSALPEMRWNLIDHRNAPAPDITPATTSNVDTWILGSGSVGSSVVALMGTGDPAGRVDIVDADGFDPERNPYRYPAATTSTDGPKAAWASRILRAGGWSADGHEVDVATWVTSRSGPGFDGVAVSSVDRVDARADVADALARTTLSVGVGGLAFHAQREQPADPFACPYCQYLTVGTPMSQLGVYEEQTGIPMVRIAQLLGGDRLAAEDVALAVASGRIQAEASEDMIGRRFEDLVRRAYAQATVRTVDGESVTVSAPAVSWLAGTVVAAEIEKMKKGLPLLDRRIDLDMSGVPTGMVRQVARDRSGRCLCANPFRIRSARRLYGTS